MNEPPWGRIMREQAERRPDMERLRSWAEANPDRAAGHGWDTSAAEAGTGPTRYTIGVVGDVQAATRELRLLLERPELLDVVPRRFTWTQLCALRDAIASEYRGQTTEQGTRITTIGPAMLENKVRVTLNNSDEQFAATLAAKYGSDRVIVEYNVTISYPESHSPPEDGA